ncbi:Uncharacterised protein [Legionella busanensis]|uniref:Zinc-ribbon domain-containing protein n=1 Tax=Legionella busanensis TaxID=190655 RepID=A0A378JTQ9_9GAMM|nr:hypothetical protein [Legionella busanensis]STX51572.1 Uncharacterised protein [Legionella busanensis]
MPLTNCVDCKKEISTNAENCPNCGAPLKSKSLISKNLGFGSLIDSVIILLGLILIFTGKILGLILILIGVILLLFRIKIWSVIGRK